MDILSGLLGVGSIMNNKEVQVHDNINTTRVKRTPINGNNLYDNAKYRTTKRYEDNIAYDRYKLAKDPMNTGVIPNFYNQLQTVTKRKQAIKEEYLKQKKQKDEYRKKTEKKIEGFENDSMFSDDDTLYSRRSNDGKSLDGSLNLNNDHMAFFKRGNMLSDTSYHEKRFINKARNNETNGFMSQFEDIAFDNPSSPVSSNNVHNKSGNNANISKLEMERELALKGNYSSFEDNNDMTYGIVDDKNFVHNNMVPNFKSGIGKGYEPNSRVTQQFDSIKQRKLELFSGSTKDLNYRPKTERRPLFNPQVGLTWIYGMPNFTNYFESRYIPSRERRNELLHQPVRVTPGLNKGYNEVSKEGFNDTWRVLPKTVDELRAANDPKISYEGRIIEGMKGERRPIIPNVGKYKPVKFKEQDPRDLVKSLGYYRGPSVYGNYDAPSTNRQMTTKVWYGPVEFLKDQPRPESMLEKVRLPNRENFLSPTPRNVTKVDGDKNTSYTANTYYMQPTNRITTQHNGYVNPAGPEYHKGHAFDMQTNIPDPTRRNATEVKTWNNPAGPEYKKPYAFDMNTNIPDPTRRNTTELRTWNNPAGPEYKKPYAFDMNTNIPDPTKRNLIENFTQLNPAGPEYKKPYAFDMNTNIPDPTKRNLTENFTQLNPAGPEYKKPYAFDMNTNIPDPTKRNLTEIQSYINPAGPEWKKAVAFDMQTNIPDPTKRNLTEIKTYVNPVGPEWQKGGYQVEVQNTVAQPTLRQLTQINANLSNVGTGELNKGGYQAEIAGVHAPPTLRQLTQINANLSNVGTGELNKGGYQVEVQNTVAQPTLRQLTQNNTYIANAGPTEREKGAYQVEVQNTVAQPTLRQLTQNNTYITNAGPNEREKGAYQVAVQNTVAQPTLRQLTQNNTYIAQAGPNEKEKGAYQVNVQNTVARPTLRQLTQNNTYVTQAGPNEKEKGAYQVNVQNTVAPTTLRQLTQNNTYIANAGPNEREKGAYQVNVQNTVARPTLRQLTQFKTYQGPAVLHEGSKTRNRGDVNNSLVNVQKDINTVIRDGGAPTTSNYNIGPIYDFTMVQLCEPIQINRDVYGSAPWQNPLGCVSTMYTRAPQQIPEQEWRNNDPCILSGLKSNPYINNLVHKSVEY